MYFAALVLRNVYSRKVRSILTGFAIAVSIMTVVAMGILTDSLRTTAVSILHTGSADFSIAQKNVTDVLYSSIDQKNIEQIKQDPGVRQIVGVLVSAYSLDANNPFFLRIGIPPDELAPFGVHVLTGQAYSATATNEIMLGYRAASSLNKKVGDEMTFDNVNYKIVGIYSTGQVFGDTASMWPLVTLQAVVREPGTVTLAFVKVKPGASISQVRARIQGQFPQLATVRTQSDFGQVDRNLELLTAANTGVTWLALVIGAVIVLNMMVLTIFERTREFGVLRAVGWSRRRIVAEVMSEALIVTFVGAGVGIGAGFALISILQNAPSLRGLFVPELTSGVFTRALLIAFGMAFFGALYPAVRAGLLKPLAAIQHE